ncbi:unnamed protein product [Chrysodeixis includens]|uniref:Beta-1,3-glucan-binding protein n=1 Tax=Chrysodeixis includens TaxID=689277 RepID=A0A9P0BLW4_CHRIL|nr:unnamed protein product [Chrysodeixis includens]
MFLKNMSFVSFVFFLFSFNYVLCYEVPRARLEAIYPRGLKVSIPDDRYTLFAFHGKLNQEMEGLEAGHWSGDITKPKNGRWTYRDRNAKLKIGDTVYYWTYVIKDGLGYREDNGQWTVTHFVDEAGKPVAVDADGIAHNAVTSPRPETLAPATSPPLDVLDNVQYPCELSVSKVNVPGFVCQGQLLFEDHFNASIAKGKVWTPENKFVGEPDFPFNMYLQDNSVTVEDGKLSIKPVTLESIYGENFVRQTLDINARCTGVIGTTDCAREASGAQILPPIVSAKITTKNTFAFKFGKIEVRAKLPLGDWIYPEIQLEPRDNIYGINNYASGIIRVATNKGNAEFSKKLYAGPIMSATEPYRSSHLRERTGSDAWTKDFHIYSVEWRPDGISLFVDGEKYGEVRPPSEGFYKSASENHVQAASQWLKGTVMAPFDDMFYIAVGLNVGGVREFADNDNKPWKNEATKAMINFWNARDQWHSTWFEERALQIDYVRVFAL